MQGSRHVRAYRIVYSVRHPSSFEEMCRNTIRHNTIATPLVSDVDQVYLAANAATLSLAEWNPHAQCIVGLGLCATAAIQQSNNTLGVLCRRSIVGTAKSEI